MSVKILKTSLYFTALSTFASAINFTFYPVISHMLSVVNFGDVQVGVSFIMLAAALLTSLSTLALFAAAKRDVEQQTLGHIERLVISLSIIGAILTSVFAHPIASLLQLQDQSLLYILSFIFILNIPASTWIGSLQGNGQFIASGWLSTISAVTKLIAALSFISIGWGAHGALLGIAVGTFIALPLAKYVDRSDTIRYRETFGVLRKTDIIFFIRRFDLIVILFSLIALAFIANIDVLVAKTILSPTDAGAYAQLSTVAKIPYFAGIPISLILFERFIKRSINYHTSLIAYTVIVAGVGCSVALLSEPILKLMFNYRAETIAPLFPLLVSFVSYSILSLTIYRLIATKQTKKLLFVAIGGIVIAGLLLTGTTNTSSIASSYMYSILVTLSLSIILTYTKSHE